MLTPEQEQQVRQQVHSQAIATVEVEIVECEARLEIARFDLSQARAKLVALRGTLAAPEEG
jgi:hypothetical protein